MKFAKLKKKLKLYKARAKGFYQGGSRALEGIGRGVEIGAKSINPVLIGIEKGKKKERKLNLMETIDTGKFIPKVAY